MNPQIENEKESDNNILYLNSGDWVENLTSLEFDKEWKLYTHG